MNRKLYYVVWVVIIACMMESKADVPAAVAAPRAAAQAAQAPDKAAAVAPQPPAPIAEVREIKGPKNLSVVSEEQEEVLSAAEQRKLERKRKIGSIENTYDIEADLAKKQAGMQAGERDDLAAMGLVGPELEEMLKKRRMITNLVRKGKDFFLKNSLDVACNAIIKTKQFKLGEVYLFIYDTDGYCLAQGGDTANLWSDFKHEKVGMDEYGSMFVNDFIEKARAGGGWVSYRYHNGSKVSYVELIEKGTTQYVIGGGFYPHSKIYAVMNLVKGAVRFFRDSEDKNIKEDSIFSTLSYPVGRFVSGDLYIFALDEDGNLMVQGERPTLVGSNVLMAADPTGKRINQEIINRLNKTPEGIWLDYISKNAPKKVYAERVTAKDGRNYYIACGYYPDASDKKLQEIVQEGYRHMKKGVEQAFKDFNDHNDHIFHYGDIYLEVYDMKGKCVANGSDQELIGRSYWDEKDEMGNFYMKKMIGMAKKDGKGWISEKRKNSYEWTYFEKVNVGLEEYIVTAGLYPLSKVESMELLARDAVEYLKSVKEVKFAFRDFIKQSGRFSLGDLEIFVFEPNGICIVNGSNTEYVWKNMIDNKDEVGRPYVKEMINAARRTPARVKYRMNGADALAYVERVDKGGRSFYVGSSLYTYNNVEVGGTSDADTTVMKKTKKAKTQE